MIIGGEKSEDLLSTVRTFVYGEQNVLTEVCELLSFADMSQYLPARKRKSDKRQSA